MHNSDEMDILKKVAEGNQSAFGEFVALHGPPLFKHALRVLKTTELAEEVVQDVFVQCWQVRETLPQINNIRNYLFVISKGVTIDALRKYIRERKSYQQYKQQQPSGSFDIVAEDNSAHIIEAAIRNLSPQQEKVWIMSRRQKLTYEQIAAELRISRDAVNKYMQTANKNLLQFIKKHKDLLMLIIVAILFF